MTSPKIAMRPVASSQIAEIGHDPDTNTLAIRFRSKRPAPGSLYHYDHVDAETFQAFANADSIGSYFYTHIKPDPDRYPYKKIDETPGNP